MYSFGFNVMDFGAKGDGVTDDTAAIQSAIDFCATRGGGRILFPYTKKGYRVASPGREEYEGAPLRAQLVIPPSFEHNILLEGEMPCRLLNTYQVRPIDSVERFGFSPTMFGTMRNNNTFIFSDWEAPEVHDQNERPWAVIAAPMGNVGKGKFSASQFSIHNLEFRVHLDTKKMYPTESCVNLQNVCRVNIADSQFCLDEQIGDTFLNKELQKNPCHTAGLIISGDQNDNNIVRNVAVQGFKYGIVAGEHVVAECLYIHNCEEGITFHDCSHLSTINHIVAQHNRTVLTTTRGTLFNMNPGPCFVTVNGVDCEDGLGEDGNGTKPEISQMKCGVYDPDNRLHGILYWHKPFGEQTFLKLGAENFDVKRI